MNYREHEINYMLLTKYDIFVIELEETAVLTSWGEYRNVFFLQDDYFSRKTDCNLIYHDIRSDIEILVSNASVSEKIDELKSRYLISDNLAKELFAQEEKHVISLSKPRMYINSLYNKIIKDEKKVYFVINDNMDVCVAEEILHKCGYDKYDGIFSKSDICDKLINCIASDEKILLIGRTKLLNWDNTSHLFIPETRYVFSGEYNKNIMYKQAALRAAGNIIYLPNVMRTPGYSIMSQFIANKFFDNPNVEWKLGTEFNVDPYFLGYSALGMHIAGVIKWLSEQLGKKEYKRILFCARDGFLIKQAYDYYCKYNCNLPKSEYIQASRKLLMPVLLKSESDFYNIPGVIYYSYSPHRIMLLLWQFSIYSPLYDFRHTTYGEYEEEIKEKIENAGFNYDDYFETQKQLTRFIAFYLDAFYDAEKHAILIKNVQDYYKEYSAGDVIFDAGYSGKLPKAIIECSSGISDVFYLYSDGENSESIQRIGDFSIGNFYDFRPAVDNVIREYLISENAPSCVGIMSIEGKLIPVFETECEEYCRSEAIMEIQKGALDFIKDVYDTFQDKWRFFPFKGYEVSLPFEGFIREITEGDLEMFSNTYQEDYNTGIATEHKWGSYYKNIMRAFPNAIVCGEVNDKVMTSDDLKVSVIITTYNRKYEVARALRSVYAQSIVPYEIIIVDDGSTDGTREYLESHVPGHYKYIYNAKRKGPGYSRNIGITVSNGEYIAFLDSDNEWYNNKLECFVAALNSLDMPDVVCSKYYKHVGFDKYIFPGMPAEEELPLDLEILLHNFADASASMYRKSLLEEVGGFSESMKTNIDWELLLRAYRKRKITVCKIQDVLSENWTMDDGLSTQTDLEFKERLELLEEYSNDIVDKKLKALFYKQYAYDHTEFVSENDKRNNFFKWVGYTPFWMECAYEFSDGVINALLSKIEDSSSIIDDISGQLDESKRQLDESDKRWENTNRQLEHMNNQLDRKNNFYNFLYSWLELNHSGLSIASELKKEKIDSIAIYGFGKHGKLAFYELRNSSIKINYIIDNRLKEESIEGIKVYSVNDNFPDVDAIIVSPYMEFESINELLSRKSSAKIISLEELVKRTYQNTKEF